jgi:hypothetical protein
MRRGRLRQAATPDREHGGVAGVGRALDISATEVELAAEVASLSLVKAKLSARSTDMTNFLHVAAGIEVEWKTTPEHLLKGKDRALLKQFRTLLDDTARRPRSASPAPGNA